MASKPTSRWNFLQQAVASVESRLDNILAEENEPPKSTSTLVETSQEPVPSKRSLSQSLAIAFPALTYV